MKPQRRAGAAAFLLAVASAFGALPATAQTAPAVRLAAAPAIDALEVNADAGLQPGSVLEFSMRGTPNGIARAEVRDAGVSVALRETRPGIYTGQYTVRRTDRLKPTSLVRGELTVAGRTRNSDFRLPPSFAQAPAEPALMPVPTTQVPTLHLDRFSAPSVDRLVPGTELRFAIEGTPGAYATVQVPGLPTPVQLREQRPGHYAGQYVLRQQDAVGDGPVIATLRAGERTVTAQLARPLVVAVPGNTMGAAPMSVLPLQVISPGPNAAIDASQVVVQGRTAPGASVHVRVDAIAPVAVGRSAVAQTLPPQTVQADANGNFSFNFGPVRAQPGTRFEVNLSAAQGAQSTPEQRIVLFQRS
ncbi:hypothetical protein EZ216_10310 [Ramlibacter humi]|uniref:Uncharacterized protein n=1 Tax=Ramlibacter humi TaxID=2530451 RepID=A0A4Z0C1A5_9BURK|nr:hypothetical protein EZ216_10310 [Ramlibacter humi]